MKILSLIFYSLGFIILNSCTQSNAEWSPARQLCDPEPNLPGFRKALSPIELEMLSAGLVDIKSIDSSIAVDIKYASENNFLHTNFYQDFNKAYLQPDVALKLAKAQSFLKEQHPDYSLLIYDAARPLRFQQQIWDSIKLPVAQKTRYVSNPKHGSLHNFGAAVDLTLIGPNHKELDMGCPFDTLSPIAYPVLEWKFLAEGLLSQQQVDNRKLLRQVMQQAGFFNIQTEWWHFNACTRAEAITKYKRIE